MSYIIPIKASLTSTDELSRVLSGVKAEGLDVSVQTTNSSGLAMDTATVTKVAFRSSAIATAGAPGISF